MMKREAGSRRDRGPGTADLPVPVFFGDPQRSLFGLFHAALAPTRRRGVVVCSPLGYESILCHRAGRHLAQRLASAGIPALRFDYDGTGDSVGSDHDPDRLRMWIASIHAATAQLKRHASLDEIFLVGTRMGATLAVLAARERAVDGLVLWAPCVSGRLYAREMKVLAMAGSLGEAVVDAGSGALDVAGFTLSAECLGDLSGIDLLDGDAPRVRRALVIGRTDLSDDTRLSDKLGELGVDADYRRCDGFQGMMAEPHFNVVPDDAIATIVDWVGRDGDDNGHDRAPDGGSSGVDSAAADASAPSSTTFQVAVPTIASDTDGTAPVTETACRFGPEERLFGVLTRGAGQASPPRFAVLLLNTGSVHHIGSNRTYVTLARRMAALGVPSLRFDVGGIGDSAGLDVAVENHPYPQNLRADLDSALGLLKAQLGCDRFILLGLCSGAFAAFHGALGSDRIVESIMVNPLTFRWEEGMSLETPPHQHYADVSKYKKSVWSLPSWRRMLRGQVNVRRVASVGVKQLGRGAMAHFRSARGTFMGTSLEGDLNNDLRRLAKQGTHLTFIFSKGDPGFDLLRTEAVWMVRRLRRRHAMTLVVINGADHTFTPRPARRRLIDAIFERVLEHARRVDDLADAGAPTRQRRA